MSARAGHPEIYTMDADGTNVDLLTPLEISERAYRASPTGRPMAGSVAFQSRVAGTFQMMTISLRDRGLKQLTSEGRTAIRRGRPMDATSCSCRIAVA